MHEYLMMSHNEVSRLEVINNLLSKRLKQTDAAEILGMTVRQVQIHVFRLDKKIY